MSIIGIDAGTSIIKLVNVDKENNIIHKRIIDKMPILQALEEFIHNENIRIEEVTKIVITGIGSAEVGNNIYDIPTIKVDEFQAIGKGGLYLSNNERGLVVSIGTGTAFVKAEGTNFSHVGGTGVGGGTLLNLCKKISCINSFNEINELILKGNLHNVDLTIKDITNQEIKTLPADTTSANFGKLNEKATKEDIALGIANMVFEVIGMMAVFWTQNTNIKDIIVVGSVATMPYMRTVFTKIEKMYNLKFIIPNEAEFATVIGAIKLAV